MPLMRQTVNVSMTSGINTKKDEKLVTPAELLELENAVFTKAGALNKRFGYETLPKTITGGGEIEAGEAIGIYNDELNLYTGKKMYSYGKTNRSWVEKGNVVSVIAKDAPIIKNGYDQNNVSCDSLGNITCYAWEDDRGGVRFSVIDQQFGTVYVFDKQLSVDASAPKVTKLGDFLVIWYTEAGDTSLRYQYVSKNTPSDIAGPFIFTNDMNASNNYDVVLVGDRQFVAYHDDTSTVSVRTITDGFVISAPTFIPQNATNALFITTDENQNVWISFSNASDEIAVTVYNFLLAELLPVTVIETIADVVNMTGCVVGNQMQLWYTISNAETQDYLIQTSTIDITGSFSVLGVFKRSVGLASKVFIFNDLCYVNVVHVSQFQSTYFTVSNEGNIVAKMSYGTSGDHSGNSLLTEVPQIGPSTFLFGHQEKTSIDTEDSEIFSTFGIFATSLDFSSENKFQNAQLGQLHIVGGILQSYDGVSVTEHNFHLFPEGSTFTAQAAGGSLSDGTRSYQICYEWTDNLGQIHRSAPSIAEQLVLSGGGASQSVDITIPTLRLTAKRDNRAPVRLVVYRTTADGTNYYRVTSIIAPLLNDTDVDSLNFTDTLSDETIITNDLLYTTGGIFENTAPPSSSLVVTYKNRVFLAGLPDQLTYAYSKEREAGLPVEFVSEFGDRVDAEGGPITALAVLDSNLLLFKSQAVFFISGDGPNSAGGGSDYGDAQLITTDAGCVDPNSVEQTPDGIMFKSSKGIYIINRSLQVQYIGDRVEGFNGLTISSGASVPDTNQIRYVTEEGTTLMYDYYFNQWGTFTNQPAEDSDVWDGRFVYLRSDGQVWKENDSFTDGNLPISMKITTGWISMAQMQGFQRIYRMIFLGDYKSDHKMEVAIGYDFNPNFSQFATIDIGDVYNIQAYGDTSPYGSDDSSFGYGGGYPLYEFKTHMTQQKCTSLRFRFQDSQTHLNTFGEGYSLSNIALEVGVKKTLRKYSAVNNFGTS